MKKNIVLLSLFILPAYVCLAQKVEYKVVTSVESIVPMGLGRSMLVENQQDVDLSKLSTDREGGKSQQRSVKRSDAKVEEIKETKLLNFYSAVGINFQNIASNDAIISAKLNELADAGWELAFISSGVESDAGDGDGKGIFITRYIFKRIIK